MFYKTTLFSHTGEQQQLIIAPTETHVTQWCESQMSVYGLIDFDIECVSTSSAYEPDAPMPTHVVGF